jgi:hypothetical protein
MEINFFLLDIGIFLVSSSQETVSCSDISWESTVAARVAGRQSLMHRAEFSVVAKAAHPTS